MCADVGEQCSELAKVQSCRIRGKSGSPRVKVSVLRGVMPEQSASSQVNVVGYSRPS